MTTTHDRTRPTAPSSAPPRARQELDRAADVVGAVERLRETGAVLRLSEADAADDRAGTEVARRRDA